jgi:hypothetical protein
MANNQFTNNAGSTLASSISNSATSLTVTTASGTLFPTITGSQYFYCTLEEVSSGALEIVKVTARVSDTFTIVRAQDGTSALAFSAGDRVQLRLTAADLNNFSQIDSSNTFLADQTINGKIVGEGGGSDSTNTVVGAGLPSNTTGQYNTAIGTTALAANTTGSLNTAVGFLASAGNTTTSGNVAVGNNALWLNSASHNTAVGSYALENNTGSGNTAVGRQALRFNTSGENDAFGYHALLSNTIGTDNVAIGKNSLDSNTTGSYNTAVGNEAGHTVLTGDYNTYLGNNATASSTNTTSELVICATNGSTGKGSNTGFIVPGSGAMYQGNNSASWSTTSDERLKKNIVDNNIGLEVLNQIKVKNFEYRLSEEIETDLIKTDAINKKGIQLGVIAQELQQVLPECVKQETTGVLSVDTGNLTWYLINAIKQLSTEVELLKQQLGK